MTRIVFLGTPATAVPSLRALGSQVVMVVTRPDRGAGRSRKPRPSPVKLAASQLGIDVFQPERSADLAATIASAQADVAVVVAFGMLIPAPALSLPAKGFVNVHFSLLPRWRGAAPVERAILAGDHETGVTIMQLDEGLDTGPLLASRTLPLSSESDAVGVTDALADLGAELLAETLPSYLRGELQPRAQPDDGVTYAKRIDTSEMKIDPSMSAETVDRVIRAFTARGGAYGFHDGERVKIWRARPAVGPDLEPGRLAVHEGAVFLGTGRGDLELLEVQPAGRNRMEAAAWARGRKLGSLR
ncbi:MAG: methionyl-tRNA formyltransferase [Gammaproteobacteria bacterium]|nr:methionyl-tRNA formyltransferase [Gammaproteobacteria bacterium]